MGLNATLLGQMGTFIVFVLFTLKYVWPPISQALEERQKKIAEGLASAEHSQQELERAQEEARSILRQAQEKASEIVEQAQQRAGRMVDEAKEDAQKERARQLEAARHEIALESTRAREALRTEVAALAVAGAEQIIQRELDAKSHSDVLDRLTAEI